MHTAFDDQRVTILRQRVRGYTPDPLRVRLRLEALLARANLRPSGLPPTAILCVRALHDPMPGTLRLSGYSSQLPQHWEAALADALDAVARNAVRPLYQHVPANAEAVIFEDRAEMLACLALDWAKEMLAYRWWWRSLIRSYDLKQVVWSEWLDTPQYVPSALAHLAACGEVVTVLNRMDDAMVIDLIKSVLNAFRLDSLARAVEQAVTDAALHFTTPSHRGIPVSERSDQAPRAFSDHASQTPSAPVAAPWVERVPEALDASLTVPRRLLLGITLSLVRDPVGVRGAAFAWEAQRWMQNPTAETPEISRETPTPVPFEAGRNEIIVEDDAPATTRPHKPEFREAPSADEHSEAVPDAVRDSQPVAASSEIISSENVETVTPSPQAEAVTPLVGTPIETAFGGLFYLINLAMYLGFYVDYAMPRSDELELSVWDFVTLVGAELLGGMPPDAIWEVLAALAGRDPDEPPGMYFAPPDTWRIPLRWLDAFPEPAACTWAVETGRLRVEHPAGFLLVDVPFEGDPSPQLAEIADFYGVDKLVEGSVAVLTNDPLRRWLGWLMPYVRARLCRALGVEDDPAPLLCRHYARVFVTPSHVDIVLSLDTLPIEIRLAGLDRNPGWLPSAGRTITFHFESSGG